MSASPSTSKGALTERTRGAIPVSSTNDKAPVTQEPDAGQCVALHKVARPVLSGGQGREALPYHNLAGFAGAWEVAALRLTPARGRNLKTQCLQRSRERAL